MNYFIKHRDIAFILTTLPFKFVKTGNKKSGDCCIHKHSMHVLEMPSNILNILISKAIQVKRNIRQRDT